MAAYYRPITLDLGLNRGRERIVRDRERIVYVWKLIEKMDFVVMTSLQLCSLIAGRVSTTLTVAKSPPLSRKLWRTTI